MRIHWETPANPGSSISPTKITVLTWMPHIPPNVPLIGPSAAPGQPPPQNQNATFIGQNPSPSRGYLAVGTETGVIGITATDTADFGTFEEKDLPLRYNFNLRGHHSKIQRCSWNHTMTKLASCDENGIIYVWVPNDERWSVELVNDRGLKVRDFNWSQNGQAALILYEDNFVLIGSANGQRIWSSTFLQQINCGAWAPTSKEFVLGLDNGQIQVYNDQGMLIADRQLLPLPIQRVAFSSQEAGWTLAVVSARDQIFFLNSTYEVEHRSWQSSDPIKMIQWSASGQMLAVVCKTGNIIILNTEARLIHSFKPPLNLSDDPTIAFTWAHNDEVVIVSANGGLAIGRVFPEVPALADLVGYKLWLSMGRTAREAGRLGLPDRLAQMVKQYDRHVIRCRIPSYERMCRFVCEPTFWRWYCTIVPIPRKNFHYMLCLEHMGGLVPILLGRQINRVIPQFIISLPPASAFSAPSYLRKHFNHPIGEHQVGQRWDFASNGNPNLPLKPSTVVFSSGQQDPLQAPSIEDEGTEYGYSSTVGTEFNSNDDDLAAQSQRNLPRNTVWRRSKRRIKKFVSKKLSPRGAKASRMLCHVRSNVWCTKFKITSPGIKDLPMTLANVVYKTSVLHLQPRQMTINLCDLRPLTKTLKEQKLQQPHICSEHRRFRSADSSPAIRRRVTGLDNELILEGDNDADDFPGNNNLEIGQGVVSPATSAIVPQQIAVEQQLNQRYTTYAETRARLLREQRRPMHRTPVSQQGQNAAATQAGRRVRRLLRFPRRAAAEDHAIGEPPPQQLAGQRRGHGNGGNGDEPPQQPQQRHVHFHQHPQNPNPTPNPSEHDLLIDLDEDEPATSSAPQPNELMDEEKRLYENLRQEFDGLYAAVNEKVAKMRSIADELDTVQQQASSSSSSSSSGSDSGRRDSTQIKSDVSKPQKSQKKSDLLQAKSDKSDSPQKLVEKKEIGQKSAELQKQVTRNLPKSTDPPKHSSKSLTKSVKSDLPLTKSVKSDLWQSRVNSLDFIDDDAEGLFASSSSALPRNRRPEPDTMSDTVPLLASSPKLAAPQRTASVTSSPVKEKKGQELRLVDRLGSMMETMRFGSQKKEKVEEEKKLIMEEEKEEDKEEEEEQEPTPSSSSHLPASNPPQTVEQMRTHFRDIARKTAQIETILNAKDIHGDLKLRIQRIKAILGETSHAADLIEPSRGFAANRKLPLPQHKLAIFNEFGDDGMIPEEIQSERGASPTEGTEGPLYQSIRMTNKTPFWNDDSQVYQLDFGGRVTQESAKNFQIEFDTDQVMQFGRIENGAYTLDFMSPLSAVQAFGIALASITQRLK